MKKKIAVAVTVVAIAGLPVRAHALNTFGWNVLSIKTVMKAVKVVPDATKPSLVEVAARCPKGTHPVTGGAFFLAKGLGPNPDPSTASVTRLIGSYPTKNGWTAIGYSVSNEKDIKLYALAQCSTLVTEVVTSSLPISPPTVTPSIGATGIAECPFHGNDQDSAISGGDYLTGPSSSLLRSTLAGSDLEQNPWRWSANGTNGGTKTLTLHLVFLCTPALPDYEAFHVVNAPATPPNTTVGGYTAQCPSGSHALAGSAQWFSSGIVDSSEALVASSSVTSDSTAWFFAGFNGPHDPHDFSSKYLCLHD